MSGEAVARPALVEEHYPLARLTTVGTGGPARYFARPRDEQELQAVLRWAAAVGVAPAVVGLGSNLLPADSGFDGLVLRLEGALAAVEIVGDEARCGGGAGLAVVVRRATEAGLTGVEFASAIPGTVGGAVRMNAGAYGRELRDCLGEAVVVSAEGIRHGGPSELELSYRRSNVGPQEVVARATLRLEREDRDRVRARVRELQARRSAAQPRKVRTFGSVFKNPGGELTSGRMLEACGLKGYAVGGARISPVHANFIENTGEATSADIVALMVEARRRAQERFGVRLEHEVQLLGEIEIPEG